MGTNAQEVAVLVGIPQSLRTRVERHVAGRIQICTLPLEQSGGYRLQAPPSHAANLLEQFADNASSYQKVLVLLLPYARIPEELQSVARTLRELGANVLRPVLDPEHEDYSSVWPARSPRMDKGFQDALFAAICRLLDREFPRQMDDARDHEIACDIIRGLAVHSKMGPNNHSHEDDLWKSCQHNLGPGDRERVVKWLSGEGLLERKKNASMGGKGWVYWIEDVEKAKAFCPHLEAYFV